MSSNITIKRHNHWFYRCEPSQKQAMLVKLLSDHTGKSILILHAQPLPFSIEADSGDVTIMTDEMITKEQIARFDLLIHVDLPEKALQYIKRLACTKELSIGLLSPDDAKLLYPIETLMGRNIMQKELEGFEQEVKVEEKPEQGDRPQRSYKGSDRYPDERRDARPKKKFGKPADPAKQRQRNHHKDGTVRSQEEREEYQRRRSETGQKKKSFDNKRSNEEKGERKPFGDKKKFDKKPRSDRDFKEKKPFNKDGKKQERDDRKPFNKKRDGEGKKPFDKKRDDRKSFDKKRDYDGKKPFDKKRDDRRKDDQNSEGKRPSEPKRKPRNFGVKTLKKDTDK